MHPYIIIVGSSSITISIIIFFIRSSSIIITIIMTTFTKAHRQRLLSIGDRQREMERVAEVQTRDLEMQLAKDKEQVSGLRYA